MIIDNTNQTPNIKKIRNEARFDYKCHLQVNPQGVRVTAVDVYLAEHVEGDVVLPRGELLDLGLGARLLAAELVAGESQDA